MPLTLLRPDDGYGSQYWGEFVWGERGYSTYPLPPGLQLKGDEQQTRFDTADYAFADGAHTEGEELRDRVVTVSGLVGDPALSRQAHADLLAELKHQAKVPGALLRVDTGSHLRLTQLRSFDVRPEPLWDRKISSVSIEWQCDDPFWYADAKQTQTFTLSGDGTFTVDAGTGQKPNYRGQFPRITVACPALGLVPSLTLKNTSDAGMQLRYADPKMQLGAVAVIDCEHGLVTRGSDNTIQYMHGEFLRLVSGDNVFEYTGAACTITFEWQPRWL